MLNQTLLLGIFVAVQETDKVNIKGAPKAKGKQRSRQKQTPVFKYN